MKNSIEDNLFIIKVLKRKLRRNIVRIEYDMEWLSFEKKVTFATQKIRQIPFSKAKMMISFWEPSDKILSVLKSCNCNDWNILREYNGKQTSGLIEVYFEHKINEHPLETIIRKHYGYELGKKDVLSLDLIMAFEKDNKITISHLYDDRGFRIYELM